MSIEFLTAERAEAFGRFATEPTATELERFFFFDDEDRRLIDRRRRSHNRLGFALQLATVRYIGTFLADPLDVPWPVVEHVAGQLGIVDGSVVKRYATERESTRWEHAAEIRNEFGYRDFGDPVVAKELDGFLAGRAWTHAEGPVALFDHATAWLRLRRVLLPGVSVLARAVSTARSDAADRMHATLADAARLADPGLPARLVGLLDVVEGQRFSTLELLRRPPRRTTGRAMTQALQRAADVLTIGARAAAVDAVPVGRLGALARYGLTTKAPALRELVEPRRTATLLGAARHLEAAAVDDALDLFDVLMATRLLSTARRIAMSERLEAMPRLERASCTLSNATRAWFATLDAADEDGVIEVRVAWAAIEAVASRESVVEAADVVDELIPDDGYAEAAVRDALTDKYGVVRPFLALLGDVLPLAATADATPLLNEVRRLEGLARRRTGHRPLDPTEIDTSLIPGAWHRAIFANRALPVGAVDRDAYVLCVLEQLHRALRCRDVFAAPSRRWSDPRAALLAGAEWAKGRDEILTGLGLTDPVDGHLGQLTDALDVAWKLLASHLTDAGPDASIRLRPKKGNSDGRVGLAVDRLGAVEEPPSLVALRDTVSRMLPKVDLPDLLLEVHAWTGFLHAYTHVAEQSHRLDDLPVSIAALLVAEACNVGLTPVTTSRIPALTRARLSHVDQNYIRADTHSAANACLIDAQGAIPITQAWGGGLVASVDGMRFVVPIATINAAPSPRYFGLRRGVTWLNAVNDQVAGIGAVLVPGTMRDSLYILDTLLNLDGGPRPEMIATDTASYSDIVFGLFRLLGYRFSPRIADVGEQRFWRATPPSSPSGDYGPLNALARNRINLNRVRTHWNDMLRVAGSLVTGRVRAYDLLRMFARDGHATPLGNAFAEYGRIAKTLHLLALIDPIDDTYRRRVSRQLTVHENRHSLGRKIFHGQRGELRQPYREGQEDQLGALGLVINAVVLWNTRYTDAAVNAFVAGGALVQQDDIARLSPLTHAHLNVLGRYTFAPPTSRGLRPLRDPSNNSDD